MAVTEYDDLQYVYIDGTANDVGIYNTTGSSGNYSTYTISTPEYVGEMQPAPEFTILSPEASALNNLLERLNEFRQWLQEEQCDLEEECGADLSGLIDKLEETFPELSGECETSDGFNEEGNLIETEPYLRHLRRSLSEALGVDLEEVDEVGLGSNIEDFIG